MVDNLTTVHNCRWAEPVRSLSLSEVMYLVSNLANGAEMNAQKWMEKSSRAWPVLRHFKERISSGFLVSGCYACEDDDSGDRHHRRLSCGKFRLKEGTKGLSRKRLLGKDLEQFSLWLSVSHYSVF